MSNCGRVLLCAASYFFGWLWYHWHTLSCNAVIESLALCNQAYDTAFPIPRRFADDMDAGLTARSQPRVAYGSSYGPHHICAWGIRSKLAVLAVATALIVTVAVVAYHGVKSADNSSGGTTPAPQLNWMNLVLLDTEFPAARCLDGSPSGFYYRAGARNSTTWVIFLEGGDICREISDCVDRKSSMLGSSRNWARTKLNPNAILNDRDITNPFRTAHHIYVPYCGGDAHSGNRTATFEYFGVNHTLVFAGHTTIMATVATLLEEFGMVNATRVLVSGDSAGGLGAYLNIDFITDALADAAPNAIVKGAPLGGYYLARNISTFGEWQAGDEYGDFDLSIAFDLHEFYGSVLDISCAVALDANDSYCGTVGVLFRYLQTPILIAENVYDGDKIYTRLGCPNPPYGAGEDFISYYGQRLVTSVKNGIEQSNISYEHGYWLPSCTDHTGNLGVGTVQSYTLVWWSFAVA
eukprot:m.924511 g.924511  ORF g.924511 m.924511 type:complete len:465 (-) comp23769_c0_seq12:365-1759(-)